MRSSRTLVDVGERWCALLESVLGATLQEFESPILRHADLRKHRPSAPTGWRLELPWSQLLVLVSSVGWVPPVGFAVLLRLVTGILDGPERRGARRGSVRLGTRTLCRTPGQSGADCRAQSVSGVDRRRVGCRPTVSDQSMWRVYSSNVTRTSLAGLRGVGYARLSSSTGMMRTLAVWRAYSAKPG